MLFLSEKTAVNDKKHRQKLQKGRKCATIKQKRNKMH